jgi:hypothetical protein
MADPTTLTKTTAPGAYAAAGGAVTMTAADVANGNRFVPSGKDLIIAHNTGVAERHVTVTSVVDEMNRLGTIAAEAIAAGAIRIYGPLPVDGWASGGYILCSADNAEVKFGIVTLP